MVAVIVDHLLLANHLNAQNGAKMLSCYIDVNGSLMSNSHALFSVMWPVAVFLCIGQLTFIALLLKCTTDDHASIMIDIGRCSVLYVCKNASP